MSHKYEVCISHLADSNYTIEHAKEILEKALERDYVNNSETYEVD